MTCSPAQFAANLANAKKSTGPRTREGKEKSRRNSYKHGLTGAGFVIASEDVAVIEARFDDFRADLRPRNSVASFLVQQTAMLSVRLDRNARHEASMTSDRVRRAVREFDVLRLDEADRQYDWITADPAAGARRLRQTPEGIDRMVRALLGLKEDLLHPNQVRWDWQHLEKIENMAGRRLNDLPVSRARVLSEAVGGEFKYLEADDAPGLEGPARREWARHRLAEMIDAEVESLQALMETLDHEDLALERAQSVDRANFDPGKEATLARKYEAANRRAFLRTLQEFDKRNKVVPDEPEPGPDPEDEAELPETPEPEPRYEEKLGSSFPQIIERHPEGPRPAPTPPSHAPGRPDRRPERPRRPSRISKR